MAEMIQIDGSAGEGGGQILRTSLGLSACSGRPFAIAGIRQKRKKPGLMRQHLTAVLAAAEVCQADVEGAAIGSLGLTFAPGAVRAGDYRFAVGTAGSTTLVLQTVLPPLLQADGPSKVVIEGGTHNPWSPPFDFLAGSFMPALAKFGPQVTARCTRPGFYPAGGGRIEVEIQPGGALRPVELMERGKLLERRAVATVARLPGTIAERELEVVRKKLGFQQEELRVHSAKASLGPGNVLSIEHRYENVTEIQTGFGELGVSAERVARGAVRDAKKYLETDAPVGAHLADQLLIPMALAGGGAFRTVAPTMHTRTNCEVVGQFLPVSFDVVEDGAEFVIRVAAR